MHDIDTRVEVGGKMKKLRQAVALIKEWALETKQRASGVRMLKAIDDELDKAGLDDQGSVVVPAMDELRREPYRTVPQPAKAAKIANKDHRLEDAVPSGDQDGKEQ